MTVKKRLVPFFLALALVFLVAGDVAGWGFWAHKEITREAVGLMPDPIAPFFRAHRQYLIDHSVDPDLARRTDSLEQFHHYLDIDYYGTYPFERLPRSYEAAVSRYGADTVRRYGLLPWKIVEFMQLLGKAMQEGDRDRILERACYLAHYVQDAHVPLHATLNYDGQLTNQKGLHSRFESHVPETFGKEYRYQFPESVEPLADPLQYAFEIILESYTYVDSVLAGDLGAKERVPADKLTTTVIREGKETVRYSQEYYHAFHELLGDLPRRRMEQSAVAVARYWYTAWVIAGKPRLPEP